MPCYLGLTFHPDEHPAIVSLDVQFVIDILRKTDGMETTTRLPNHTT